MNKNLPYISTEDYQYHLPEDKIARFPLENRQESRLLFYNRGKISHRIFKELPDVLPEKALLYFNNTKVIPARLNFVKPSGAAIEIFIVNPQVRHTPVHEALHGSTPAYWQCLIGNKKRWKKGTPLSLKTDGPDSQVLIAELVDEEKNIVRFTWEDPARSFLEIIEKTGNVPLPPYLKRKPVAEDKPRYQTVYSEREGAVAAPTAGLHFTNDIIDTLRANGHSTDFLTLHVSVGTFQPIKERNAIDHPMHNEQIVVEFRNLENLLQGRFTIAVGTTSMRTLESIYWYGVKLLSGTDDEAFKIGKLEPYRAPGKLPERKEAIQAVKDHMRRQGKAELTGETEILIVPGYDFKVCDGLFTNFHLPGSTLILLVAAFAGDDWKKIYDEALNKNYRFLSYGDGSFLIRR